MNTVERLAAMLIRRFNAARLPERAPLAVCVERVPQRGWRVAARRLGAFKLHHENVPVAQKLFFDEYKNIYVPNALEKAPVPASGHIARALLRTGCGSAKARAVFYKKISPADAGILLEQAAQLLARRYAAFHDSGVAPIEL